MPPLRENVAFLRYLSGFAWCRHCRNYHPSMTDDGEPVARRTRSHDFQARFNFRRSLSPTEALSANSVPVPENLHVGGSSHSEDLDYMDTDSSNDADISSTDSGSDQDYQVPPREARHLHQAISTEERFHLELHSSADTIRAQFPETRLEPYANSSLNDLVCRDCGEIVHDDDWLDANPPDYAAHRNSDEYCRACSRLRPDFMFRAGYCNCRCQCAEIALEAGYNSDSSSEVVFVDIQRREPVLRRNLHDLDLRDSDGFDLSMDDTASERRAGQDLSAGRYGEDEDELFDGESRSSGSPLSDDDEAEPQGTTGAHTIWLPQGMTGESFFALLREMIEYPGEYDRWVPEGMTAESLSETLLQVFSQILSAINTGDEVHWEELEEVD